jgi:YfiH family protein
VLTADCLPVIFASRDGGRVGVAHAGWRGLLNGVLPAAIRALRAPPAEIVAWLGPAIGAASYEVGADVRDAYLARDSAASTAFTPNARGRWQADLYALARASLAGAGVKDVHGGGFCTYREADRFFSHRREAPCGRFATLVWLAPR